MEAARAIRAAGVFVLALTLGAAGIPEPAGRAVPRTHAHNDYEHEHPLFDALHEGFVGVEADVYLVGEELRVSHDKAEDWTKVPTLERSYLTPLAKLKANQRNGGVYPDGTRLLLLIDIKSEAEATYRRLHEVLQLYQSSTPGLFTGYTKDGLGKYHTSRGAVDVVITGNRPREFMARQDGRYACYDGRLADVGPDVKPDDAPEFVPLVSDNWKNVFGDKTVWDGSGEMPPAVRAKLDRIVADAHGEGKMLRFWNVPKDGPTTWGPLLDAGVDLINTDDLVGLSRFVRSRQAFRRGTTPRRGASPPGAGPARPPSRPRE